jgi:hypothetical protein
MATLIHLERLGQLYRFDPALSVREYEVRRMWALPKAWKWIVEVLPGAGSSWNIQERPEEQLDALIYEFCVGQPLAVGARFKCLTHLGDGIWELKTADLRLFGWFTLKDCFVVSDIDDTSRIKRSNLYQGYCQQAVRRRNSLDLNEPKFVPGDNPDDVVSDWN